MKLLSAGALLIAFTTDTTAQGNAIVARYGIGTSQNTYMNWSDWAWGMDTNIDFENFEFGATREIQSFGSFSAELKIKASPRVKVLGAVATTPFVIKEGSRRSDVDMITVAGGLQFMYIETSTTRLYSDFLIGYTTVDVSGNAVTPTSTGFVNGHGTLIGVEVGRILFFTAELGYGIKGAFNAGAGIRF